MPEWCQSLLAHRRNRERETGEGMVVLTEARKIGWWDGPMMLLLDRTDDVVRGKNDTGVVDPRIELLPTLLQCETESIVRGRRGAEDSGGGKPADAMQVQYNPGAEPTRMLQHETRHEW